MTTTTVTFTAIGQPQHITAPRHPMSHREAIRETSSHH